MPLAQTRRVLLSTQWETKRELSREGRWGLKRDLYHDMMYFFYEVVELEPHRRRAIRGERERQMKRGRGRERGSTGSGEDVGREKVKENN